LKLLLDTHIWLWLFREPKRLGRRTLRELTNENNALWLSPISTWEILTLHQKGKLKFRGDVAEWTTRATVGTKEAPFTHEIALAARQFPVDLDPADQMLAATALVLDLTLVTADDRLLELATIHTMSNR
jgi:PIN domain nuclease of toxin-antitoxin system